MTLGGSKDDSDRMIGSGEGTMNCLDDGNRRPSRRGWDECAVKMTEEVDHATGRWIFSTKG